MTLLAQTIVSTMVTRIEAATIVTDSGSPAQYKKSGAAVLDNAQDLQFEIVPRQMPMLEDVTGATGAAHRFATFVVRLKVSSGGRGTRTISPSAVSTSAAFRTPSICRFLLLWRISAHSSRSIHPTRRPAPTS